MDTAINKSSMSNNQNQPLSLSTEQIATLADNMAASAISFNTVQGYENFIQARDALLNYLDVKALLYVDKDSE